MTSILKPLCLSLFLLALAAPAAVAADPWNVYDGFDGPGKGKHVVLISGDEEYRSEEALSQLGMILTKHHGFKCTVLYAIDADTGIINPNNGHNIPGLHNLKTADLMVIATRFRDLPDDQMKHIDDYLRRGGAVIGMRTATHAFRIDGRKPYGHYGNGYQGDKKEWRGGFGRLILGEKWINHHGQHGSQSTGGVAAPGQKEHPILRGIKDRDIWGASDVYTVRLPLPGDSQPIVLGQVLDNMTKDGTPIDGEKNKPLMPIGWTKSYQIPGGRQGQSFATTLGASSDLIAAGSRRMLVNATYHLLGLEIPEGGTRVDLVGKFKPTKFGVMGEDYWLQKNIKPSAYKMPK
jgi:hypothetical protein